MKKTDNFDFIPGHIYVFNSSGDRDETAVWGVFDRRQNETIFMEVMSSDMHDFIYGRALPSALCFVREASHEEVRDFAFNYGIETVLIRNPRFRT